MTLHRPKNWTKTIFVLAAVFLLSTAGAAFAAVPTVVVDAQESLATGLGSPQSVVVAPNGTYYVADTGSNVVYAYTNGVRSTVYTGTGEHYTLHTPNALAVDSSGDLFIGDSPSSKTGRVIEIFANANGSLSRTVTQVVSGGGLQDVFSLTVATLNGTNTLYIGDDLSNSIFYVRAGSTTLHKLTTGLPTDVVPAALAVDASGNLYVADFYSTLYELASGSTQAAAVDVTGFSLNSPTGLTFDPAGNLYVLTLLNGSAVSNQNYILEIPAGDLTGTPGGAWSNAFEIPVTGIGNGSGIAFNSTGTLYVVDFLNGDLQGLIYGAAVNLGTATVGGAGTAVTFNYEINAPITSTGFQGISLGDASTEAQKAAGGTCTLTQYTDGDNGGAIAVNNPYTCVESWYAVPDYPGIRSGAIAFGNADTIYAATPVFSTGEAGASVIYPLADSTAATGFNAPTGLAVSGLDQKLYIIDSGAAQIFSANGPDGTTLAEVPTTPITMSIPYKIALNGNGDLYIADFGVNSTLGQIVVVPRSSSQTPYSSNTAGNPFGTVLQSLLQHPLSIAFDTYGNLYIGDSGPDGSGASASKPGYIVEVPVNGTTPFKLTTTGETIIFPQTITTDPYTAAVYVGDGGDDTGNGAKVVEIPSGGGRATNVTPTAEKDVTGGPDPVEIVFDPAEQFYVLDGSSSEVYLVPPQGSSYILPFDNSLFTFPRALAITNGGQNFVEANLNPTPGTTNNLVFLNGKSSTLNFGSVLVGQGQFGSMAATVDNIGTTALTLGNPYYTTSGSLSPFSISDGTTCGNRVSLNPASTCYINVKFSPTSAVSYSKQLTLSTNGYITNDSVLNLTGTGVGRTGPGVTIARGRGNSFQSGDPSQRRHDFRQNFFSHSHAISQGSHSAAGDSHSATGDPHSASDNRSAGFDR